VVGLGPYTHRGLSPSTKEVAPTAARGAGMRKRSPLSTILRGQGSRRRLPREDVGNSVNMTGRRGLPYLRWQKIPRARARARDTAAKRILSRTGFDGDPAPFHIPPV
jgi:hypothetical protein